MTWIAEKEKLLCLMVLDDNLTQKLQINAGPAFFRGFIVQNRQTNEVCAKFRYKYEDGRRSWYTITDKKSGSTEQAVEYLRCGIEDVIKTAMPTFRPGTFSPAEIAASITCFYPPDDGGDGGRTIIWLEEKDLIEIIEVKEKP